MNTAVKQFITPIKNGAMLIRVLVVESDPASRQKIVDTLSTYPSVRVVHECGNGFEAISAVREFKPDILICEVEVPGLDGFAIVETIPPKNRPATIFTSNHEHFAAGAFDVSATDYLVKPFGSDRLLKAIERARNQVDIQKNQEPAIHASAPAKQLLIQSGRSVIFVKYDELDWAEAEGKYVRLHMGKEFLMLKMSITALEAELDPTRFVRIHRSTLINIDRVRRVQPWNRRRTYQVTLQDGTRLVLSRKSRLLNMSGKIISTIPDALTTQ